MVELKKPVTSDAQPGTRYIWNCGASTCSDENVIGLQLMVTDPYGLWGLKLLPAGVQGDP